jgi:hypothetical protein
MSRIDLNSTTLSAAAYLEQDRVLELEFTSGGIYHYLKVPAEIYQALLQATSHGAYFNRSIRNHFACVRVHAAPSPKVISCSNQ